MTHKKIETDGETIIVSDNNVAKRFDPISLTGGPQEYGEIKTGFIAQLKGRALQRYETMNESNTQFFCDFIFNNNNQKKIDGVLHSFRFDTSSKMIGIFLDLQSALKIGELLSKEKENQKVEIRNVFIKTTQEKFHFKTFKTIKYFEMREIVNGTALVMISFAEQ